jgi:hypothetical protein
VGGAGGGVRGYNIGTPSWKLKKLVNKNIINPKIISPL